MNKYNVGDVVNAEFKVVGECTEPKGTLYTLESKEERCLYMWGDELESEPKDGIVVITLTVTGVDLNADGEGGTFYNLKHSAELDMYLEETELQEVSKV